MSNRPKIVLMDGHSILNRAFYGIPMLTNSQGIHTNAVYGFLNILFKFLDEEKADYAAVAFDLHAPTFRHKMYDAYKGTRKPMPEELREQVPLMKKMLEAMGIPVLTMEGYEADDILGTISRQMQAEGFQVAVISGDRDLLQLATDEICIRIPKTKATGTEVEDYFAADVKEKYQVTPTQFIDVKALMGDTSDNIPGLPGVGEKTATKIIAQFGSIEEAYAHVDEVTPPRAREALRNQYELAQLSKVLATIDVNVPIRLDMEAAHIDTLFTPQAKQMCRELGFKNLLARFPKEEEAEPAREEWIRLQDTGEVQRLADRILQMDEDAGSRIPVGLCLITEEKELLGAAIALPQEQRAYFIPIPYDLEATASEKVDKPAEGTTAEEQGKSAAGTAKKPGKAAETSAEISGNNSKGTAPDVLVKTRIKEAAEKPAEEADAPGTGEAFGTGDVPGTGEDLLLVSVLPALLRTILVPGRPAATISWKSQIPFLNLDRDALPQMLDASIAAYLVNPLTESYACEDLAKAYADRLIPSRAELFGKKSLKEACAADPEHFLAYACLQARIALDVREPLLNRLEELGMSDLLWNIEMPLTYTLSDMEQEGIRVEAEALNTYGAQLVGRIGELEQQIHAEAGKEFNILSPKQLGSILFEDLKLPSGKKTKSGYSTAADVLEKLAPDYPIVAHVLEYRQLTKLKSTYADGLAAFIAPDGRIHGKFHQTVTATGRISSADPNLQNIPVRMELGRLIRKVFVPKPGFVFVDADYSQIELRVLAHLSGDEKLIQAYQDARDIHTITASQVFHVAPEDVTPLLRRNAKAVNFGIVYGISSFGLSQDLSITRKEAQEYIEQYFRTYPGIKEFLDKTVADAKTNGYVTTMFGRRRPMPELKSSNFMQRSFGERVAMNAPIQGTAADIIKIAMNRVNEALRREHLRSRLILQVHDELLIETAIEEEEQVCEILSREMHQAADLRVPLEIDMHTGSDWYEAK